MLKKVLLLVTSVSLAVAGCSSEPEVLVGYENPEQAVVAWFGGIDGGNPVDASRAVHAESLALILGIENGLDSNRIAHYLNEGVPLDVQATYWASFAEGFVEFAARPISTLNVGASERFAAEGVEFASVPVSGGLGGESIIITRMRDDGSWEVDLIASLGDGFIQLLAIEYDELPGDEAGERVRQAYVEIVVPSLWAAMDDGRFGDMFARTALALIDRIDAETSELS